MVVVANITTATSALRLLQSTNRELDITSRRIASGLKVAEAKDNPSVWRATTELRSEVKSISTVQGILANARASIASGSNALASTRNILGEMKALLVSAKASGANLDVVQSSLTALKAELRSTAASASFSGMNLLSVDTSAPGYSSKFSFLSTASGSASGGNSANTMGFDTQYTKLFDAGARADGILQRRIDLSAAIGSAVTAPSIAGLSGTAMETLGQAAASPALGGLAGAATATAGLAAVAPAPFAALSQGQFVDGYYASTPVSTGLSGTATGVVVGQAAVTATSAKAIVGTFDPDSSGIKSGDTIQLNMTVNSVVRSVRVYLRSVENAATLQAELQRALNAAYGNDTLIANVAADNKISIQSAATGSGQSVSVTSFDVLDGNDNITSTLSLQTQADYNYGKSTINGQDRSRDSLNGFNLGGIDRTDRLELKIDGKLSDANGGNTGSVTIQIKLASVTNGVSLAKAIDDEIARTNAKDYFGAHWDGNNILVYHKHADAGIRVSQITAINGDGTAAGSNIGFTDGLSTGTAGAAPAAASIRTGSDFSGAITLEDGASLSFRLGIEGESPTEVKITRSLVDQVLGASAGGTIATNGQLASVVQAALEAQNITGFTVAVDGARLKFIKTGPEITGQKLTLNVLPESKGPDRFSVLTTGADFAGPLTVAANASIEFEMKIGSSGTTKATITKAVVDAALANQSGYDGSGTIANADEFALVVRKAMDGAGISGLTVAAVGNRITFTRTSAGSTTLLLTNATDKATATQATLTTESDFSGAVTVGAGTAIRFDLQLDNGTARTIAIDTATVDAALAGAAGYVTGSGRIGDIAQFALVAQRALNDAGVSGVTVAAAGAKLRFTKVVAGAGSLSLGNVTADGTTASAATTRTGSDFSGPVTLGAKATISFDFSVDDAAPTAVVINRSTVEAALASEAGYVAGSGTISDASQYAKVVARALSESGITGILVAANANRLTFTKAVAGAGGLTIDNARSSAGSLATSDITIETIDVGSTDFRGLVAAERQSALDALIAGVDARIKDVVNAEAYLGSVAKRFSIQTSFLQNLQDIMTTRINDLVKADISEETARQKALQARQQLALQSLQLLNQTQRNILDLFKR